MTLVIMAAGMGSRFGGLKQIEPIDEYGNFIIDYSIYDAIKVGFTKVVFIIKKENYELFRETVGARCEKYIETEYVFQELDNLPVGYSVPNERVKPWGTAHAIMCCHDKVNENFAIVNADDFYGRDAYQVMYDFLSNNHDDNMYAMVGYKVVNTITENGSVKRGVCQEKDGYLTELIESSISKENDKYIAVPLDGGESMEIVENQLVSMNMFGFTPKLFEFLETEFPKFLDSNADNIEKAEFLIPMEVFKQIKAGIVKVKVLDTNARWQGVTYREDKEIVVNELKNLVNKGEYPEGLWK